MENGFNSEKLTRKREQGGSARYVLIYLLFEAAYTPDMSYHLLSRTPVHSDIHSDASQTY